MFDSIKSKFQFKFKDRIYAANILAAALQDFLGKDKERSENVTVLGVPRGGIIVADIVAANDYNTFKNCLSNADSTKGYATKKEIRQCITQAYPPPLNSTSSPSTNTGVVTPTPAG